MECSMKPQRKRERKNELEICDMANDQVENISCVSNIEFPLQIVLTQCKNAFDRHFRGYYFHSKTV